MSDQVKDWQTIDTAPKDGRALLLFSPGTNGGRWISRYEPQAEWSAVATAKPMTADFWGRGRVSDIPPPTHWMDLPAPPALEPAPAIR